MTAGSYHRHIFRPPILLKTPFQRISVFFLKKYSSSNFVIFPNFLIFAKILTVNLEKNFQEVRAFDTHSTAFLPRLPILKKKFFNKNQISLRI